MHYNIPLPPGPDLNSCMFSSLCFSFNRLKRILLINSNCAAGLAACLGNMTQLFGDWMADPVKNPWVLSRFNHSVIPRVYSLHIIARQNLNVVRTKDRNGTPNTRECVSDVLTFVTPKRKVKQSKFKRKNITKIFLITQTVAHRFGSLLF